MNYSDVFTFKVKNPLCLGHDMPDVTIVIPVKDEEVGLKYLLEDFENSKLFNNDQISFIFVIDSRTSDKSKSIALKFSDNVVDQHDTFGKGSAIIQAISIYEKNPTPYIIFLDADGSYSFNGVYSIIQQLKSGQQVVSGSRFLNSYPNSLGMSKLHIFGNKFLSRISSIKNRKNITDLCTGLWGFTFESASKLNLQSSGFDLEAEIMGKVRIENLQHKEISIKWSERKGGKSKLRSFKDGFIILFRIIRT